MTKVAGSAQSTIAETNPWLNPLNRGGHRIAARLVGLDQPTVREMVAIDDLNSACARVIANRQWSLRERVVMSDYCGNFRQIGEVAYCESTDEGHWVVGIVFQWPLRAAASTVPARAAANR